MSPTSPEAGQGQQKSFRRKSSEQRLMLPLQYYCCIFISVEGKMESLGLDDPSGLRSECKRALGRQKLLQSEAIEYHMHSRNLTRMSFNSQDSRDWGYSSPHIRVETMEVSRGP